MNFGNSLHNVPTATSFRNIGALNCQHDLHIFKENENWYGWTIIKLSNSLTRLNFGNTLISTPDVRRIGSVKNISFPHSISKNFGKGNDAYFDGEKTRTKNLKGDLTLIR